MNLKERLAEHNRHSELVLLFVDTLDVKTQLFFIRLLETVMGTLKLHAGLASVASDKKEFLFHLQEMDKADQIIIDALRKLNHKCFKMSTLDSIILGADKLIVLQPKAAEFDLIGD